MGTVDKADFFEVLKDRKWHPLAEIVYALKNRVPPEIASQFYTKHNRRNAEIRAKQNGEEMDPPTASMAEMVNRGRRSFIRKRLMDSTDHGFIKKQKCGPGNDDWQFAWAQWSCWNCGQLQNATPETPDHLCKDCCTVVNTMAAPLADRLAALTDEVVQELRDLRNERDNAVRKLRSAASAE